MATTTIPRLPAWLGYAGLLPFMFLAICLWWIPPQWQSSFQAALLGYAAVILSFMGAVHWGLGMLHLQGIGRWQLGLSVIPPLIAWAALLAPGIWGFSLLIASFGLLCVADSYAVKKQLAPAWYPGLRKPLTVIVMAALITGALGTI
jgi:hypothetical protein